MPNEDTLDTEKLDSDDSLKLREAVVEEDLNKFIDAKEGDNAEIIKGSVKPEVSAEKDLRVAEEVQKEEDKKEPIAREKKKNKIAAIVGKLIALVIGIFKGVGRKILNAFKKLSKANHNIKVALIKRLIILTVFIVAVTLFLISFKIEKEIESRIVRLNTNEMNNYGVNKYFTINGEEIGIMDLSMSSSNTIFRTTDLQGLSNYEIMLTDDRDNFYAMDMQYLNLFGKSLTNMIAFEPIKDGANKLYLNFTNKITGSTEELCFIFNKSVMQSGEKYFIKEENSIDDLQLEYAEFSKSSTVIGMSLMDSEAKTKYSGPSETTDPKIYLYEGNDLIPSRNLRPFVSMYSDGLYFQTAFAEVTTGSKEALYAVVEDVYKKITIGKKIKVSDLMTNGEIVFEFKDYDLVVEGIAKSGDTAVLVYHVKDKNNYTDYKFRGVTDGIEDRNEGVLNAKLLINNVEFKGDLTQGEIGGDLVFTDDRLKKTKIYDAEIFIEDVFIKEPNYRLEVPRETYSNAEVRGDLEYIEKAFNDRLAVRVNKNVLSNVKGFDNSILYDEELGKLYEPINSKNEIYYNASINNIAYDDKFVYCVIEETVERNTVESMILEKRVHYAKYDIYKKLIVEDAYTLVE
ncbi:MAG: hypothetical protein ACK5LT_07495 [Lachnospirales bacterium]